MDTEPLQWVWIFAKKYFELSSDLYLLIHTDGDGGCGCFTQRYPVKLYSDINKLKKGLKRKQYEASIYNKHNIGYRSVSIYQFNLDKDVKEYNLVTNNFKF